MHVGLGQWWHLRGFVRRHFGGIWFSFDPKTKFLVFQLQALKTHGQEGPRTLLPLLSLFHADRQLQYMWLMCQRTQGRIGLTAPQVVKHLMK